MIETDIADKKSLLFFSSPDMVSWKELAKDCVAFANARGGEVVFGIEDADSAPDPDQIIDPQWINRIHRAIPQHTMGVSIAPVIRKWENGGEVLVVHIDGNRQSVACTTDARYFLRVGDQSKPVYPADLPRLLAEKDIYVWETQVSAKVPRDRLDAEKLRRFLTAIRSSERVKRFVKEKTDGELLDHYLLTSGTHLTNLGILWIGTREDRARLRYAPVLQFIKYDELGKKVRKQTWDDYSLNPAELIEGVWTEIPEWRDSTEFPDGMFRKTVPHYDEVIIRELLANALVHRPYTTAGDIFINLHPEHLEIHNPGRLPLGVTPDNILHQSVRRNDHLAQVFHDLRLMEREGSGYDRMYEVLLFQSKPLPRITEDDDRVVVRVDRTILKPEILDFLSRADLDLDLRQKEKIALGLLAQHGSLTALEFSKLLELPDEARLRDWLGSLPDRGIVRSSGRTRGTRYAIEPAILASFDFTQTTTLREIEPHRLRALILEDLVRYSPTAETPSKRADIHQRIGPEIPPRRIRTCLEELRTAGEVEMTGDRGKAAYHLRENLPNKPSSA